MLKKFSTYVIIFLILFSTSIIFNLISYKKYHLNFTVYSDNIGLIESMIHNEKNLSDNFFSSLYYARSTTGKVIVGLKSNDLENSKIFLTKIRNDFRDHVLGELNRLYDSSHYFLDSMDLNVKYDRKTIQKLLINNQEFFTDTNNRLYNYDSEKNNQKFITDTNNKVYTDEDFEKNNEKLIKRIEEVYGFQEGDLDSIDNLIKFLMHYISNKGVSEIKIDINQNKLISVNEIFISILFSLIFTLTIYSVRKV